jgi:hypothetical protein
MRNKMTMCRSVIVAALLVLCGGSLALPTTAAAETMTWRVKSTYKYKVQVAFYSQARKYEWPGGGDAYNLNDSETHEYPIRCEEDEKICFGGWVTGNAKKYWGVGYNNAHDCTNCCFLCGGGEIPTQVLNEGDD